MGNTIRLLMFAAAMFLGYVGYQKQDRPSPDPPTPPVITPDRVELIIESETETFPSMPSTGLVEALKALDSLVTDPDDALKLARAFKHWSNQIRYDSYITNLTKYQEVRVGSLRSLVQADKLNGRYEGQVEAVLKKAYDTHLASLKGPDETQTEVTPQVRQLLVELNEAISWKFSTIWLRNVKPITPQMEQY